MPILSIAQQEERYQAGLRRDLKAESDRRFVAPVVDHVLHGLYVCYVWRKKSGRMQWLLAGFARLKPTPARIKRWRKRLRVVRGEIMRVVELSVARQVGAGSAPTFAPRKVERLSPKPAPLRTMKSKKRRLTDHAWYDTVGGTVIRPARTRLRRKAKKAGAK